MNFEQARFNMVEQQIRPWEVLDQDVLDLLMTVKREEFVPAERRKLAFSEVELPIGHGQVMLKPIIEGKILQALQVQRSETVLEVGAGSGYFAALLAASSAKVTSLEIEPELVSLARTNLARYGQLGNVTVELADGMQGWAAQAPYDVIVLSGGVEQVPQALLDQLKPGGRLFAFVGDATLMKARVMTNVAPGQYRIEDVFESSVPFLKNAPRVESFQF